MTEKGLGTDRAQLEQALVALESQRAVLGDAVVDAALESIREKLSASIAAASAAAASVSFPVRTAYQCQTREISVELISRNGDGRATRLESSTSGTVSARAFLKYGPGFAIASVYTSARATRS